MRDDIKDPTLWDNTICNPIRNVPSLQNSAQYFWKGGRANNGATPKIPFIGGARALFNASRVCVCEWVCFWKGTPYRSVSLLKTATTTKRERNFYERAQLTMEAGLTASFSQKISFPTLSNSMNRRLLYVRRSPFSKVFISPITGDRWMPKIKDAKERKRETEKGKERERKPLLRYPTK